MLIRCVLAIALICGYSYVSFVMNSYSNRMDVLESLKQLDPQIDKGQLTQQLNTQHQLRTSVNVVGWLVVVGIGS